MSDLTPETIAPLRELDAARTQGEWRVYYPGQCCDDTCIAADGGGGVHDADVSVDDAYAIAAAANHMGALLDAAEERDEWKRQHEVIWEASKELEAEVARLRAELTICERTSQRNADVHMAEHKRANDNARKLAATRERAETTEAELAEARAERSDALTELAEARAVIERVTALTDEWTARAIARGYTGLDSAAHAADELRAALAPATQREDGER